MKSRTYTLIASGALGSALIASLIADGHGVIRLIRRDPRPGERALREIQSHRRQVRVRRHAKREREAAQEMGARQPQVRG